jgi:pimeloyl-ACP methyl ester carboxylesterase
MRNVSFKNYFQKLFSIILCASILCGAFADVATAQTRRGARTPKTVAVKQPIKQGGNSQTRACNGGWSGVVTFKKTLNETRDQGKKKNIARGTTHITYSRDYEYAGSIFVDGSRGAGAIQTKSQLNLRDDEKNWKRYEQFEDCAHDRVNKPQSQWSETVDNRLTNAFSDEAADFNMAVNEFSGTYRFGFRFPEARGVEDRTDKVTKGGWCSARLNEGSGSDDPKKSPTTVSGEQVSIDDGKIDPRSPDVITGTKTWDTSTPNVKSFSYIVTWKFKRCPAPIEVTDIRFDDRFYPDYKTWKEIELLNGTIDGNIVRIRATVTNFSNETKFPQIKFYETVENWVLPDGETSIRLEPGESREIELRWDTAGYAWRGKGWDAESYRAIRVEAEDNGRISQLTKAVTVNPRPVILVHGLWSNAAAWAGYDKFFEEGHGIFWKSYAVGANPSVAKMDTGESFGNTAQTKTISQNADQLHKQIEFVRKKQNAWHVDIVAHSMGGLIARYYIHELMPLNYIGNRPAVTRLLMLGTPNQGSPCADLMYRALSATGNKVWALYELIPSVVERFNKSVKNRKGVRFSSLVGWRIPQTCQSPPRGDGVVSIGSARWMILDWKYSNSLLNADLTSRADFGNFVFPRLSIGPRGNQDPELVAENSDFDEPSLDRYGFNRVFQKASFKRSQKTSGDADDLATNDEPLEGLTLAKEVKLAANQTTEIEIQMKNGSRAAVVFAAPPDVSATLFDAAGKIIGVNESGSAEAKGMFRTISVEKTIAEGAWKLKLENKATTTANVILAAFADPNPLAFSIAAGKPNAAKQIPLEARLTDNGSPVAGARVVAKVQSETGKTLELTLLDDGAHGDAAANDGVYGASVENLAIGDYLIEAAAETNGQTRLAAATLTVGGEKKPAAPTKSKTVKK